MTDSLPPAPVSAPQTPDAARLRADVQAEIGRIVIGGTEAIDLLLVALLAPGHALLEGVPGVAKTTLAKAFAAALGCSFRRIQFTPDLLPADITGGAVLDTRENQFVIRRGPVFAQVVLGDEINRAPAKTQSALLEAMQEGQVTLEGESLPLPQPFLVLATQNPLEQAGVYPLPEAQVDRFLVKIRLGYPAAEAEQRMLATHDQPPAAARALLNPERVLALRAAAGAVHVSPAIQAWIVGLVRHTRAHPRVSLGASPRAALGLMRAAKAHALLDGRGFVLPDDVRALAVATLAHRITLSPEAELDGATGPDVVKDALNAVRYLGPGDR